MAHDVVIRGGTLVDGTGAPPHPADVAVRNGVFVEVGELDDPTASTEVDASGCVVAPGFIDPHTHLDAQLCWDPAASPTSLHGVTSVVMGLCGFGIAPCADGGGEYLLRSLEVVEEIPFESTSLGVPFAWTTWPEFLTHLGTLPLGVNAAGFVPHSALRYFVMGERARAEPATADDRAALVAELRRSLDAGALGFATSRGPNHNDAYGDPVPSRRADDAEIRALVGACAGRSWQINVETKFSGDAAGLVAEVEGYVGWTEEAGARLSWTPFFAEPGDDVWQQVLEHNRKVNARVRVAPQVLPQPITTTLRFDRVSVAVLVKGWGEAMGGFFDLDPDPRRARVDEAEFRRLLRDAPEDCTAMFGPCYREWVIASSPSRPELQGTTLAEAANSAGRAPTDLLCDLVVADDLATEVQTPVVNRDRDGTAQLAGEPTTMIGLGDSGAHVMSVTNYAYPTDLLARLVRDQARIPLETAVHRLTAHPAEFLGLTDRGTVAVGRPADLCVFDLDRLAVGPLTVEHDLPGGAPRLFRGASGYRAVLVNGEISVTDDQHTGRAAGTPLRAGA
ncbi:MAG: N-acyl-D-amino-acid deacylase family protein [Actinomycetota bacterium]